MGIRSKPAPGLAIPPDVSQPDPKLQACYKIIAVLFAVVLGMGMAIFWLYPPAKKSEAPSLIFQLSSLEKNTIQAKYRDVDFTKFYPGVDAAIIDEIQRQCFATRFVYEPFVQFKPMAVNHQHVTISRNGYRLGSEEQPWPIESSNFNVFVFGGSTTFGYGLANSQTLVVELQQAFRKRRGLPNIQCYNFGRGFYDSTQERLLFEILLQQGIVPDAVVFIDGLNDFYFPDRDPILTAQLKQFMAPDLPNLPKAQASGADEIIARMFANYRMVRSIAREFNIETIFVLQPLPFYEYSPDAGNYPFTPDASEFSSITHGYERLHQLFLKLREEKPAVVANVNWLGSMFAEEKGPVYLDQVHYTHAAGKQLAEAISSLFKNQPDQPGSEEQEARAGDD